MVDAYVLLRRVSPILPTETMAMKRKKITV